MNNPEGILFDENLQAQIKSKFFMVNEDPTYGKRLFFDNSGGSLRLKQAVEEKCKYEKYPDCPERYHARALQLKKVVNDGTKEIMEVIFGANQDYGALMTELTASQTMFQIVEIILESVDGDNVVVSELEHPSAFDSVEFYCKKLGKEMRIAKANPNTGRIDADEVIKLIDNKTCLLSIMTASNISGAIMDIDTIISEAKKISPNIYVISDAVQHAPHMSMDVMNNNIDAMNFAPYKFFGVRGCGFAYLSERLANLPHHKLIKKSPKTFELGTPSPGNFAAMLAVIDYVCWIGKHYSSSNDRRTLYVEGMNRIHLHEKALLNRLLNGSDKVPGLRYMNGVHVAADPQSLDNRDLIAGILIDGIEPKECVKKYLEKGVLVCERASDSLYSKRIVYALNEVNGLIRVSPMHCHDINDIDEFLLITQEIIASL